MGSFGTQRRNKKPLTPKRDEKTNRKRKADIAY